MKDTPLQIKDMHFGPTKDRQDGCLHRGTGLSMIGWNPQVNQVKSNKGTVQSFKVKSICFRASSESSNVFFFFYFIFQSHLFVYARGYIQRWQHAQHTTFSGGSKGSSLPNPSPRVSKLREEYIVGLFSHLNDIHR